MVWDFIYIIFIGKFRILTETQIYELFKNVNEHRNYLLENPIKFKYKYLTFDEVYNLLNYDYHMLILEEKNNFETSTDSFSNISDYNDIYNNVNYLERLDRIKLFRSYKLTYKIQAKLTITGSWEDTGEIFYQNSKYCNFSFIKRR